LKKGERKQTHQGHIARKERVESSTLSYWRIEQPGMTAEKRGLPAVLEEERGEKMLFSSRGG